MANVQLNGQPIDAQVRVLRPEYSAISAAKSLADDRDHLNKAIVHMPGGDDAIVFTQSKRSFREFDKMTIDGKPVRIDFTANGYTPPPKHKTLYTLGSAYSGAYYALFPAAFVGCIVGSRSAKAGWTVGAAVLAAGVAIGGIAGARTGTQPGDTTLIDRLTKH